ncbi:MAG TPA: hypothetical protein VFV38_32745 [Ktedonobacteraceae bacterium]|jgi:hypothetical protein|nr:hypothetical protein [Ktedonobacteraceae bacterium]
MQQFFTFCQLTFFACWARQSRVKTILSILAVALVIFASVQHGLHNSASMHVQHLLADNDPWNG